MVQNIMEIKNPGSSNHFEQLVWKSYGLVFMKYNWKSRNFTLLWYFCLLCFLHYLKFAILLYRRLCLGKLCWNYPSTFVVLMTFMMYITKLIGNRKYNDKIKNSADIHGQLGTKIICTVYTKLDDQWSIIMDDHLGVLAPAT